MSLVAAITREAAEHGASTKFAEDAIFAGPPHERVAKAILKVVEAPNDVLTIDAWAELTGPARRTMEGWCSAAGVTAHNGLLFARCLRGVLRLSVFGEPFSQSIDSVDRRTRLELVEMAGGDRRSGAVPVTVEDFLEKQRVLGLATILNAVRRLLVDRYPNLR
ncbi:MAG TPA: hypothetical protein VLT86_01420 [Vicinamibacterales bacterium]|nr:hypothetical protein [Vicinamibacterales bacterium]